MATHRNKNMERPRLALIVSAAIAVSILVFSARPDRQRIQYSLNGARVGTRSAFRSPTCPSKENANPRMMMKNLWTMPSQSLLARKGLVRVHSTAEDVTSKSILLQAHELASGTESNKRRTLSSLTNDELDGQVVLVRADLNVPLAPLHDEVLLDQRLKDIVPTIKYLTQKGAKVLLIGHIERLMEDGPKPVSLAPVAAKLSEILNEVVTFVSESVGPKVHTVANTMGKGTVALLENVRLGDPSRDENNDEGLAKELASVADLFVMDDFADAHLELASTVGVANQMEVAVAGLLVEKEFTYLEEKMNNPQRPFAAVIGGAKLSDKFEIINRLLDKVDGIFIGGGVANTFVKARGMQTGDSLVEDDMLNHARRLELKARNKGIKLLLPDDFLYADSYSLKSLTSSLPYNDLGEKGRVPAGWMCLDHGDLTVLNIVTQFKTARTFFWNGPIGAEELDSFAYSSHSVAALASALGASNKTSIVGGRDTVAAVDRSDMRDGISHVSTGGASFYDLIEGKILPGLSCLNPPDEVAVDIPQLTGDAPLFNVDEMD